MKTRVRVMYRAVFVVLAIGAFTAGRYGVGHAENEYDPYADDMADPGYQPALAAERDKIDTATAHGCGWECQSATTLFGDSVGTDKYGSMEAQVGATAVVLEQCYEYNGRTLYQCCSTPKCRTLYAAPGFYSHCEGNPLIKVYCLE